MIATDALKIEWFQTERIDGKQLFDGKYMEFMYLSTAYSNETTLKSAGIDIESDWSFCSEYWVSSLQSAAESKLKQSRDWKWKDRVYWIDESVCYQFQLDLQ